MIKLYNPNIIGNFEYKLSYFFNLQRQRLIKTVITIRKKGAIKIPLEYEIMETHKIYVKR